MSSEPNQLLSDTEQRLCLFISLLEPDVAESVLETMPTARREPLRGGVVSMKERPPTIGDVESVIDEFSRMFRLLRNIDPSRRTTEDAEGEQAAEGGRPAHGAQVSGDATLDSSQVSGSGMEQLRLLEPERLAMALRDEQPQIVAILAKQMSDDQAGEMLALLPAELRSGVMLKLPSTGSPAPRLVEQLINATVKRAIELDPSEMAVDGPTEERMAKLLRAMSRRQRMETLETLTEENAELAEAVQRNMFEFADLVRMDDRSVKALLTEVETESLSLALKGAPEEYLTRIVSNLSRRAGEALAEEIEFMAPPTEDTQLGARARIVQVIGKLDQDGALTLVD